MLQRMSLKSNIYMHNPSLYDLFSVDTVPMMEKQVFYRKETQGYKSILDIGSGTGNIALFLAERGKKIYCLEPSPTVLINLYGKVFNSVRLKKLVTVIPKKFKSADLGKQKFDCAVVSNVFPYIYDDAERKELLINLHEQIKKGGKLIVTFFSSSMARSITKFPDGERKVGDSTFKRYTQYRPIADLRNYSKVKITWFYEVYHNKKLLEKYREEFICRCDQVEFVISMIKSSKWKIKSILADHNYTPLQIRPDSEYIILILEK